MLTATDENIWNLFYYSVTFATACVLYILKKSDLIFQPAVSSSSASPKYANS